MKKTLPFIIIIVVGIFGYVALSAKDDCGADTCDVDLGNDRTAVVTPTKTQKDAMSSKEEKPMKGMDAGKDMDELTNDTDHGDSTGKKDKMLAKYTDYSDASLASAQESGRTLLFFYADWCPTCRDAESDIKKNISRLPEDLTILKVSFDDEAALKEKYKVVGQHTFVQVDANAEMITKWTGGRVAEIIEYIEEV